MLDIDNAIATNYRNVMKNYMNQCRKSVKADFLYKFTTVIYDANEFPIGKVVVKGNDIQILPVGDNER